MFQTRHSRKSASWLRLSKVYADWRARQMWWRRTRPRGLKGKKYSNAFYEFPYLYSSVRN